MPNETKDIIRELSHLTASGVRTSDIFDDWLDMVHATLTMLPDHMKALRESGTLAQDNEETQKTFERIRARYRDNSNYLDRFAKAFAILMNSTEEYQDTVGNVYMEFGSPSKGNGQFFTPFHVAKVMAEINSDHLAGLVHERIKAAIKGDPLAEAMLMMGMALEGNDTEEWMITRIIPSVASRIEPVKVCDPSCGSGVMFLATASSIPTWMTQMGLVQFSGMDIDQTCVKMCQINVMLYGLNGFAIRML